MSAPEIRVPRAPGQATVVRPRMTARERLARIIVRRELLVGMVRNELKIKYKNSVLGFAGSLLNPLLYLVVFYIAFTKILGSGIPAFPIWLLSGLLVWNLFSTGLGAATASVVANSSLGKQPSVRRELRQDDEPARCRRAHAIAAQLALLGIRRVSRLLARVRAHHSRARGARLRPLGGELRGGALRWRPQSRSAASRSNSSCTTSTTRR